MPYGEPVSQKTRLRFALIGAAVFALAALCAEMIFTRIRTAETLAQSHSPSLLFLVPPDPEAPTTAPPPPPRSEESEEMQRRLRDVGAQTGDVQISLAWNNTNDLDLQCIDADGERIDGNHQASRSGGLLDVDMNPTDNSLISSEARARQQEIIGTDNPNRRTRYSDHPVENIVWPTGRAPLGHYRVYVHNFCNKEQVASTPFWVEVRVRGQVKRINGNMGAQDFARNVVEPQLVYEFTVGEPTPLPQTQAPVHRASESAGPVPTPYKSSNLWHALLAAGIWGGLAGLFLPAALRIGQNLYLRLPAWSLREDGLALPAGLGVGMASAVIGQLLFSLLSTMLPYSPIPILHIAGWLLLGLLFGYGLSFQAPNLPRSAACVAGILASLIASLLMQFMAGSMGEVQARLVSGLILGGAIGVLIALPKREEETEAQLEQEAAPSARYAVRATRTQAVGSLRQDRRKP